MLSILDKFFRNIGLRSGPFGPRTPLEIFWIKLLRLFRWKRQPEPLTVRQLRDFLAEKSFNGDPLPGCTLDNLYSSIRSGLLKAISLRVKGRTNHSWVISPAEAQRFAQSKIRKATLKSLSSRLAKLESMRNWSARRAIHRRESRGSTLDEIGLQIAKEQHRRQLVTEDFESEDL